MKYLLILTLFIIGCKDKDLCEFSNGTRIAIFGNNARIWDCKNELYGPKPPDSLKLCENYCNSYGEDFSKVLQMSYGTCICNNEEGRNVQKGYIEFLNKKCKGHKK